MEFTERGTKRICQSCAAKYYDLNRAPILCPKCQAEFDPAAGVKLRSDTSYKAHSGRARSVFGRSNTADNAEVTASAPAEHDDLADGDEKPEVDDDDEAVEDVAELGDDNDDLAEIIEPTESDER
ncbi:MAG: TIGR02300 family protein [Aliidongia sp.]